MKSGLLELRWDVLCPRCRVAKTWSGSLDRLPETAHCPSCNIDYDSDFSKNVEAGFRPAPALRKLESGELTLDDGERQSAVLKARSDCLSGDATTETHDIEFLRS